MAELPTDLQIVLEFEAVKRIASFYHKSPGSFLEFHAALQQDGGKMHRDALMILKHVENICGFLGGLDEDTQVKDLSCGTVFDLFAAIRRCAVDMATLDAPRNWGLACRQITRALRRIQELLQPFLLVKEVAASSSDVPPFAAPPAVTEVPCATLRPKKRVSFAEPLADERLIPGIADLPQDPQDTGKQSPETWQKASIKNKAPSAMWEAMWERHSARWDRIERMAIQLDEKRKANKRREAAIVQKRMERAQQEATIERAQQEAASRRAEETWGFASQWSEWSRDQSCKGNSQFNWYADPSQGSWEWCWDQSHNGSEYIQDTGCQYHFDADDGSWNWPHFTHPPFPTAPAVPPSTAAAEPKIGTSFVEPAADEALRGKVAEVSSLCADLPAVESIKGSDQKLPDAQGIRGGNPVLPTAPAVPPSAAAAEPKIGTSFVEPAADEALRGKAAEVSSLCADLPAVESIKGSGQKLPDAQGIRGGNPVLPTAPAVPPLTAAAEPKIGASFVEPAADEALRGKVAEVSSLCAEMPAVESIKGSDQKLPDAQGIRGGNPVLPTAPAVPPSAAAAEPKIGASFVEPAADEALKGKAAEVSSLCAEMPAVESIKGSEHPSESRTVHRTKHVSFVEPVAGETSHSESTTLSPNPRGSETVKASPKILKTASQTFPQPFGKPFVQPLIESKRYQQLKMELNRCKDGGDSRGFAVILQEMGKEMQLAGDIPLAKEHFETALRTRYTLYGDKDHFEVAGTLHSLGQVIRKAGDPVLAKERLEESMRMKRALFGDKHRPGIAATLHELGCVNHDLEDLMAARLYLQEALQMRRSLNGETDHPDIAETLKQLAQVNHAAGDVAQGIEEMAESLRMIRSVHGNKDHADVAATLYASGRLCRDAGNLTLAKQQLMECLHMKKYHKRNDSYGTLRLLVQVCHASGDLEEEKKHLKQLVDLLEPFQVRYALREEPDYPELAPTLHETAKLCLKTGDEQEAKDYFERALTKTRKLHGKNHPDVAAILLALGKMSLQAGDLVKAKKQVEESLHMSRSLHGPKVHPEIAAALGLLGQVSQKSGDSAQARKYLEEYVHMNHSLGNGDRPEIAKVGQRGGA